MSRFTVTHIDAATKAKYKVLPWLICGIGAIFYWYEYLLRITPSVMSMELMGQYKLSALQYGDFTAYYYYAYTPMQLVVGVLMDRYGPRRLLMLACLACVIGAFMFAGSENLALAKLSRFLIGFGSAFAFVGTMKLATIWLPPERFAAISGMITSLGMLGAMAGNIVLNYLVHLKGWRSMMFLSAWLGVALVVLIWLIVHDKVRTLREVDDIPYVPDIHFGHVCSGLWESLKNSAIWINGLIGCFLYLSLSAFAELWGIRYLVQAYGLSHAQAVTANSLVFLGWAIGSPLAGWLSDILRRRRLPVTVGSLLGACVILVILYVPHIPLSMLYVLLFTFGVMCSVQVIVFAVGKEVSPRHIAGTAVSLTNMFVMASGVIFQPLIGWLLTLGWDGQIEQGVHVYSAHTYQLALSVLPVGLMLSVIFSLLLKETHAHSLRAKI